MQCFIVSFASVSQASVNEIWGKISLKIRDKFIIPKDKYIIIFKRQFDRVIKRDLKYQEAFGRHLKKLREDRDLTQIDLAAISRVSEVQISKIENGEDGPNFHTILALALGLGKHPSKLFDFEYDLKFNTDFSGKHKVKEKPGTTAHIKELVSSDFFKKERSVADVIEKCQSEFGVVLGSAPTSGALRKLVGAKTLRRVPSAVHGKYLYVENNFS